MIPKTSSKVVYNRGTLESWPRGLWGIIQFWSPILEFEVTLEIICLFLEEDFDFENERNRYFIWKERKNTPIWEQNSEKNQTMISKKLPFLGSYQAMH